MHLDAGFEQPIERRYAMGGMTPDESAARLLVVGMKRHAQRADMLLDDARLVFGTQVRESDERARQKAQAEIIVAQRERRTHAGGQLPHEAERACIAALLDLVEHDPGKRQTPIFSFVASHIDNPLVAVEITIAQGHLVAVGEPTPIDDVAYREPIDRKHGATGLEADVVSWAFRCDGRDDRSALPRARPRRTSHDVGRRVYRGAAALFEIAHSSSK